MSVVACADCGRDVITSNDSVPSSCPDCAAGGPSHGQDYQRTQARSVAADRSRRRVVGNVTEVEL